MSGSIGRRHSKWDFKDSGALAENFHDQEPRRPRETFSPSRGSRRNDSRSKERMMAWDREGNSPRMSPGLDDYKHQHHSRSPGNGWRRSYSSRSRSRSQSPVRSLRREPMVDDRSRSRTGASAQVCRDFAAGKCRRGNNCQFLHQEADVYDSRRRTAECSPPDDRESKRGRIGGPRYSPADTMDYASRSEKPVHVCSEFLRGKCRRGTSCRYLHQDTAADVFEKGSVDDVYRDRDNANRSRDICPRRNHGHEPADVFEKVPVGNVYRDRERDRPVEDVDRDRNRDRDRDRPFDDAYRRDGDRPVDDAYRRDRDRPVDDAYRRDRDRPVDDAYRRDRDRPVDDAYRRGTVRPVDDAYRRDTDRDKDRGMDRDRDRDRVRNRDRDRDSDQRSGDGYRNREHEPRKRGEILCKFFASGNCRNGNHCRFSHQVQERISPDKSEDVSRGPDHILEESLSWNGPKWNDVIAVSTVPSVQGWGEGDTAPPVHGWAEGKNAITEVSNEVNTALSGDDSWSHNLHKEERKWGGPAGLDDSQHQHEKRVVQWKTEKKNPVEGFPESGDAENFGGDMQMSPRNSKQHGLSSSDFQAPSFSNISYPGVQHNADGGASYEKPHSAGFEPQRVYNDHSTNQNPSYGKLTSQNPSYEEKKPTMYTEEGRNVFGINDTSCVIPSPTMNHPLGPGTFQIDQSDKFQPISDINTHMGGWPQFPSNFSEGSRMEPLRDCQPQVPFNPSEGSRMESLHDSSFLNSKVIDESHVIHATTSALAPATASGLSAVTTEQLVQLSHISASLAQLLENRQQLPQLSSAVDPRGVSTVSDSVAPPSQVSGNTIEPIQAAETLKQYDPVIDGIEPKVQNLDTQLLPSDVGQMNANNELDNCGNVGQQEPAPKNDENSRKTAEGTSKAPGNRPTVDVAADDAADDGKKSKDSKEVRAFKFALAELVKELLKPSWKDGQVNKDAYKTIVKKVVDKVIETQGVQIPQTKEKIDQYMSCSKPKIEKLVQAYVGKFKKS